MDRMRKTIVITAVLITCVLVAAGAVLVIGKEKNDGPSDDDAMIIGLIDNLRDGEFDKFHESMNDKMRSLIDSSGLGAIWEDHTLDMGSFISIEKIDKTRYSEHVAHDAYCLFENGGKIVNISIDNDDLVTGLYFGNYFPEDLNKVPEGLEEIDVKINEGTEWELSGKITTNGQANDTIVIIVHGSGPVDMDGTINANKIYRNLAWSLAEGSIDVLRYDKRTYAYDLDVTNALLKLTVKEETIDDAVAAAKLMKQRGYENIILMGHSMGGMLGPAMIQESNGLFNGFISLAGSPRTLSEIQADQNLAAADGNAIIKAFVNAELAKLEQMDSWSEMELLSKTIFGFPAYYVKDMNSRNTGQIAKGLDVDMLFLQGSADFQVYADKDFDKWKEILKGKNNVEFKSYEGLNHHFMLSRGNNAGTTAEYQIKGYVDQQVIDDIISFIKG